MVYQCEIQNNNLKLLLDISEQLKLKLIIYISEHILLKISQKVQLNFFIHS